MIGKYKLNRNVLHYIRIRKFLELDSRFVVYYSLRMGHAIIYTGRLYVTLKSDILKGRHETHGSMVYRATGFMEHYDSWSVCLRGNTVYGIMWFAAWSNSISYGVALSMG